MLKIDIDKSLDKRIRDYTTERKIPLEQAVESLLRSGLDLYDATGLTGPAPILENRGSLKKQCERLEENLMEFAQAMTEQSTKDIIQRAKLHNLVMKQVASANGKEKAVQFHKEYVSRERSEGLTEAMRYQRKILEGLGQVATKKMGFGGWEEDTEPKVFVEIDLDKE